MLKIRLLKDGQAIESVDTKWTLDITAIASLVDELRLKHGAELGIGQRSRDRDTKEENDDAPAEHRGAEATPLLWVPD